jgi:hypothetical protein
MPEKTVKQKKNALQQAQRIIALSKMIESAGRR